MKRLIMLLAVMGGTLNTFAQFNESGITAGFFDSSQNNTINFSNFHLPPLAVLFENAKSNPRILALAKEQQIAETEVSKQKINILNNIGGHASYSYGKTDMYGNNSSSLSPIIYQFQGSTQNYWNVGVNASVSLGELLNYGNEIKTKRYTAEKAAYTKEVAYDELKQQIALLYIKITNALVTLKTASENAAIYQGAGALNQEDFHNGNMSIEEFAMTKQRESQAVTEYQQTQTQITSDIITLEIISRTPIITNTTTDITLDGTIQKSQKQISRENKAFEKYMRKKSEKELKLLEKMEKEDKESGSNTNQSNQKK